MPDSPPLLPFLPSVQEGFYLRCEGVPVVYNTGRGTTNFLIGLGIGVGIGMLFAPLSGEETREWLTENAEDRIKRLRRQGRRWVFQVQDVDRKSTRLNSSHSQISYA